MEVIIDNSMVVTKENQEQIFIVKIKDTQTDWIIVLKEVENNPNLKVLQQ